MNECMQLMGFKKNELKIEGLSKNQMYDLFGDGWDVNLVSLIFKKLFKEHIK
jgi:site-specific DNA-cytosine methylase